MTGLLPLVVVLVTGCSVFLGPHSTITIEEAEQRVEDYSRQALASLPAYARKEGGLLATSDCHDDLTGTQGQQATLRYLIHDLQPHEYAAYFDRLDSWWLDDDFRVQADERPTREYISFKTAEGFWMKILHVDGEMELITTSPCVFPD